MFRYCEDSLAEAVATLIWVAPRLSADIQELTQVSVSLKVCFMFCQGQVCVTFNQVSFQLENKFGKPFVQQARSNMSGAVNPKVFSLFRVFLVLVQNLMKCFWQVIHRLGAEAPKKSLVENYMIEIARNYKIDYEPDPTMFLVSLQGYFFV